MFIMHPLIKTVNQDVRYVISTGSVSFYDEHCDENS